MPLVRICLRNKMDINRDLFPTDPGFRSELLYMVENLEPEGDSFSSSVKYGPGDVIFGYSDCADAA